MTHVLAVNVATAEVAFVTNSWSCGVRTDHRQYLQLRDLAVEFPFDTRDTCLLRIGDTSVSATVQCALVEPNPNRPRHGFVEFSVRANRTDAGSGVAVPLRGRSVKQSAQCEFVEGRLDAVLNTGRAVDTESLCVMPGRHVWSIRVDVLILNDDGNACDAAVWGAVAALQHYRRPQISVHGDRVEVHPSYEREPVPLSLHHIPIPITFVVTSPKSIPVSGNALGNPQLPAPFVVDPLNEELAAGAATVTVGVNGESQVCHLRKADGCDVSLPTLTAMIDAAKRIVPPVLAAIKAASEAHESRCKAALKAQFQWAQSRSGVAAATAISGAVTDASLPNDEPQRKVARRET